MTRVWVWCNNWKVIVYPTLHKTYCDVIAHLYIYKIARVYLPGNKLIPLLGRFFTWIKEKRVSEYWYMWFVKSAQYMNFIGIQSCNYGIYSTSNRGSLPPLAYFITPLQTTLPAVEYRNIIMLPKMLVHCFNICFLCFHLCNHHVCIVSLEAISVRSIWCFLVVK